MWLLVKPVNCRGFHNKTDSFHEIQRFILSILQELVENFKTLFKSILSDGE